MICEMCGKEALHLYKAIVEGSLLSVCENCKKFGEVISVEKPKVEEPKKEKKQTLEPKFVDEEKQEVVIDDYADRIKEAREKRELTQEKLASAIAEKESIIQKVESKQMVPPMQLAKRLEQFLRIKITEEFDPSKKPIKELDLKDSSITIGDLIRLKKK